MSAGDQAHGVSQETQNSLQALIPSPLTVQVAGSAVELRELTVAQLPRFLRAASPLLGALMREGGSDLAELLAHADAVVDIVVIATGQERAVIESLSASELLPVIEAVVEVNGSFFGVALPRFMAKLATKGTAAMGGWMPSSS